MQDDDAEILAAARDGYLEEAQEMLRQYEASLLVLEGDPTDAEQLNAAFRAAHTIKGGAGMFGFEDVVRFTHVAETLLDALRDGRRALDGECMDALLQSRDQIEALLGEIDQGEAANPAVLEAANGLADRLRALMGEAPAPRATAAPAPEQLAVAAAQPEGPAHWHLSLRFLPDALRNGLDPLAFLRYLGQLGTIHALHLMHAEVPALDALDAEACHLWVELRFETDKGRAEIESVFEFALEDSDVQILEPGCAPGRFESLAEKRCGLDAEKRALLFEIWRDMGVRFEVVETVVATLQEEEAVVPRIERRAEGAPREKGPDRRSGEGDRRNAPRDRRTGEDTRFIRVRADKLDTLIDLIGELVIAGSGAQMVAHHAKDEATLEAMLRVMSLMQDTRDAALGLRMVPVGETFGRFQRVVRDVSKQLGKEIELVVTGGDTEMDKSMVDAIGDPLMHLVRNSMDHGLEPPEEREAAGKPRAGTLRLNAFHEAGSIVIEVRDDGRGLARERILNKAIERGLIAPDAVLSDSDVWQLIFQPGFSTAEAVTDLSGRGVGMDVVKRNIEGLRGQIRLHSEPGNGTLTQIRLPLTLAMIDGFLTQVGEVHYVLPLAVVSECIDVPPEVQKNAERVSGTFNLRGEIVPWLDLARFYRCPVQDNRRRSVVVVREGQGGRVGLIVDRLMGEHQTVIKPLAGLFTHVKALAGSTILGSGDVALVLDVNGLMESARRVGATRN
ncbi:two-component system chemotaxis sensor kinase CheA [Inhella inkyongensis]|uniref:Chemotaxis protein CheA n=1 Tax=Inhella inkyongensis TaxID=392593 RepID=A0A840S9J7_9BURK|nr:chemotaxis protein CheA [Inhella inkyongensis]MBB5205666.1 two-component system chemotaxis sensor kinase CheA [Inhella inkyongensis]